MTGDERGRRNLFDRLEQALGQDAARALMERLPPIPWGQLATKADLHALEERMEQRMDERMASMASKADLLALEERMEQRMASKSDLETFRQDVNHRFQLLDMRFDEMGARLHATFRGELNEAITAQTRTIALATVGSAVSVGMLVLAAAQLG